MPGLRTSTTATIPASLHANGSGSSRQSESELLKGVPSNTYWPPSPPRSRSTSPYGSRQQQQLDTSAGNVARHRNIANNSTMQQIQPASSSTTMVRAGSNPAISPNGGSNATSTASQRKGSAPQSNIGLGLPNSFVYPNVAPYGDHTNGGQQHVHYAQDTKSTNGAAGAAGSLYSKASDFVSKGLQQQRSLPTHSSSSATANPLSSSTHSSASTHARSHSRRKSIAQAIAPSISTVRFVSYCALWYTSSALSSNTGKSILNRYKYPVTLTFVQFGFVAGWCIIFCVGRTKLATMKANGTSGSSSHHSRSMSVAQHYAFSKSWGIKKPTRKALESVVVMSVFQIAGHVFSSMAIARVPVSTVHTIKVSRLIHHAEATWLTPHGQALSPLFTVLSYGLLFQVRYSYNTYISLLPLTLGVMLACSFDFRANAVGFLCALGSTLVFVSQNIFSKKLLPKDGGASSHTASDGADRKLDKLHLLLYSSGMAFLGMIPLWAYYDGYRFLISSEPTVRTASWSTLVVLFTMNGTVHFLQNLLAFAILSLTSPVTYSIASLVKRIAVICMAIIWFRQPVYLVQGLGICLTFTGLYMYNLAKGDVERGENVRVRIERRNTMGSLLPTTKEDVALEDTKTGRGWGLVR